MAAQEMLTETFSDNWVALSKEKNRESFSELHVLLRAMDRFFNIENLPFPKEHVAAKNFFLELSMARDVILRILGLLESTIPESKRNIYWFQKFAVSKYLTDRKRDAFREELYKQDIPEKSLLLLYDSIINLKGVITDLLKTEQIPYLTFTNIGHIIGKDLRENTFFNPFTRDIDPEFDMIENREITKIVKSIRERETKKYLSLLFLSLFKFLRYLRHADNSAKFGSLSSSLLIILLLRSEIALFREQLGKMTDAFPDEGLRLLIRSAAYQFSVESKRVFEQELKDALAGNPLQHLRGMIENSHGILKNLSEQSVLQIVQFYKPMISGSEIFHSFMTRVEQSLRLREDLLILQRFLTLMESRKSDEGRLKVFEAMRNFMLYFQSFTFKLLRYDDYDEFSSFFERVLTFTPETAHGPKLSRLMDRIKQFRIFIDTCLRQLSNRAELQDRPASMDRIEICINQYLP